MFDVANQVSKAMRVYLEGIYKSYQNEADFLKWFKQMTEENPTNYLGRQITIETKPNPSLAFGSLDGGDLATPSNPTLDNLTVTYQWMNAGLSQSYGAILNNDKETVGDPLQRSVKSSAQQFAQWMNYYVSAGNGTTALATSSANYSGGTPTVMTCNGTTDFFGAVRVVDGQKGYIYDSTGTTQRVGTVGTGVLTISSHTNTAITFSSNIPSDMVSGDIFVPEGTNTTGIKGLPYLVAASGNLFNKSRSSIPQLQSTVITASAALSTLFLYRLYSQTAIKSGRSEEETGWMSLCFPETQKAGYYNLTVTTPQSHYFQHTTQAPQIDVGGQNLQFTWFGVRIRRFFWLLNNAVYLLDMESLKMAVLKQVGQIVNMPASDWLQALNVTTGNYKAERQQWQDFAGDAYITTPHHCGVLQTLDTTNLPTIKGSM